MHRWALAATAFALGCAIPSDDREPAAPTEDVPVATEIASPAAPGSGEPFLHVTEDGSVLLSWIEPDGEAAHRLRFARRDGEEWSDPVTIAAGADWFVNWADFPSLVELPGGDLVAHWLQRTGAGTYAYEVRVARSADGGRTWSEAVVPHDDGTETEHGFVSLFPDADGSAGVVWLDGREYAAPAGGEPPADARMTLRFARVGAEGRITSAGQLDDRVCDCCQTDVALTSRGPVVAYRNRSPAEIRDVAVVRRVDGEWTAPALVHADGWEISACPVDGPAVAARGDRMAVAWFTAARDTARVRIAFSEDAGATFGPPVEVDGGAPIGRVDLALLSDGHALVTWLEKVGPDAEIRARRVSPGGTAGPAARVAVASEARAGGFPRMAVSGERVLFAWSRPGEPAEVRVASAPLAAFPSGAGR